MDRLQKLDLQFHLKSSADKVYDIFKHKMYLLPTICPHLVQDVKLVQGDWGTVGSILLLTYVAETSESMSQTLEAVDDRSRSITLNTLEGDVGKYYKTFKATLCVVDSGNGSLVEYSLVYEKKNHNSPDPVKYSVCASDFVKSIDVYLVKHVI